MRKAISTVVVAAGLSLSLGARTAPAQTISPPNGSGANPPPAAVTPGAFAGQTSQPATFAAPSRTLRGAQLRSARTVFPAGHREFGTGRNVYLHKPWLPND